MSTNEKMNVMQDRNMQKVSSTAPYCRASQVQPPVIARNASAQR